MRNNNSSTTTLASGAGARGGASTSTSSSQAFCLKLNSHQSHMIDSFQKLYNDEVMVDCTLSCAGGTLKAHKLVLSACSPYFTSLFATFTNPYQYPVVVIKDMPFADLKVIIEFIYRGEVTVPQALLPSVLESAKTLSITGLSDIKIANFDHQTPGSASASTSAPAGKSALADLFSSCSSTHASRTRHSGSTVSPSTGTGGKRSRPSAFAQSASSSSSSVSPSAARRRLRRSSRGSAGSADSDHTAAAVVGEEEEKGGTSNGASTAAATETQSGKQDVEEGKESGYTASSEAAHDAREEEDEDQMKIEEGDRPAVEGGDVADYEMPGDEEEAGEEEEEEEDDEEGDAVAMELAGAVVSDAMAASSSTPSSQRSSTTPTGMRLTPSASLKQDLRQQRITKLQAQTGGLSGRKMWSEEEVRSLVRIWEEESARVWASAGKKQLSLKRISDLLQLDGVDRDISQVEGKIKALKRDYKAIKTDRAIASVQTRMAPYLERLDRIFLHDDLTL